MEKQKFAPFLSFTGNAEEAMQFYSSTLPNAEITKIVRYGKDNPFVGENQEDMLMLGVLSFMGQEIMFLNMDDAHPAPDFSWATCIYINCSDEAEFDVIFNGLSQGGIVMMGPEATSPLRKCAWVTDKFGVTWQPAWK